MYKSGRIKKIKFPQLSHLKKLKNANPFQWKWDPMNKLSLYSDEYYKKLHFYRACVISKQQQYIPVHVKIEKTLDQCEKLDHFKRKNQ